MKIRQLARQRALQLLYSLEFNRLPYEAGEESFLATSARSRRGWSDFPHKLAKASHERRAELDAEIVKHLRRWKIDRIPLTDRLVLRMALAEMQDFPDIPLRVTMNEYIDLARMFGQEDSPKFINGVLDNMARSFKQKDFEVTEEERRRPKPRRQPLEVPRPAEPGDETATEIPLP